MKLTPEQVEEYEKLKERDTLGELVEYPMMSRSSSKACPSCMKSVYLMSDTKFCSYCGKRLRRE